ncbi:hypothetical protein FGK63_20460 [Ruegeria sediminis]|uniref:DUF2147 domain-containing protein n=1 Tax=Ruegeria sediminis TaxID=2583820 RepID=A0ABY2WS60_9RHOB|nr:hypothetical protein [Ruegeria sediminis]TMV02603.1 hypothetical protein FGK63_20460 [Ruegeria sediminis]
MKYSIIAVPIIGLISIVNNGLALANCRNLSESEMIDAAIDFTLQNQVGNAFKLTEEGERLHLSLKRFEDKAAYLAINSDCCTNFTREAKGEYIDPHLAERKNYAATIRVKSRWLFDDRNSMKTPLLGFYESIRLVHFDNCGKIINLD